MWGDISLWLFISLMISDVECFSCACWPSVYHLWKTVHSDLLHIVSSGCLIFWCWVVWAAYIFLILTPLSITYFANIFSHSVGCLFILSLVSFPLIKTLLILIRFIFAFILFALGDRSKNIYILLWFMTQSVLPMFSSRSLWFLVLYLGLWSILSLFLCMVLESILVSGVQPSDSIIL